MSRIRLSLALLLLCAPLIATGSEDGPPAGAEESAAETGRNPEHEGYGLYQSLCAECHGIRADGKGTRAEHFDPRPADLTQLRGPNGGPLRLDTLTRLIDGRRTVRAHEAGGMPIWGERLVANEPDLRARERGRILLVQALASYVQSLQRPE